jgi:hypothetical protein
MNALTSKDCSETLSMFKNVLVSTCELAKDKMTNPVEYFAYKGVVDEMSSVQRLLSTMILKELFLEEKELGNAKFVVSGIDGLLKEYYVHV